MKKKVLVIGPSPDLSKGGMATVIRGIRDDRTLNDRFEISIFDSYIDGNKVKRAIYTGMAFEKFKRNYQGFDIYHIHVASYGSTFRKARYIKFLKRHNKTVILHIHGAAYMDFYNKLSQQKQKYVIGILKSCDLVIALSNEWKNRFENVFGLTNCVVLPNGIDTDIFEEAVLPDGVYNNSFVFLGRLGKRKGAYDLVDAVEIVSKDHPDMKLYMAGDGEIDQIKELVKQKHLEKNIQVVGWVDFKEKIALLKKTATIVLPSYNEGLPMTILEGMASGKAIISSTVGAIPEVVKSENGILIRPGDIHVLANAMKTLIENSNLISSMGKANIQKIDREFSMRKMHENLSNFYLQVV